MYLLRSIVLLYNRLQKCFSLKYVFAENSQEKFQMTDSLNVGHLSHTVWKQLQIDFQ